MRELELYLFCILGGVATLRLGGSGVEWIGYGLSILGTSMASITIIDSANPYRKLLISTKLIIDDKVPKFLGKKKTEYGYCLSFRLLPGMSTDDFEKKKLAIEQHLNRKIEIAYNNWRVFIKVYENKLETFIPYEFEKCKGMLEFNIGKVFGNRSLSLDLEKAVHLLIAGETGGGKSTLLRAIITNIILSNRKINLHLIDLKGGIEFSVFRKCKMVKSFSKTIEEAEEILSKLLIEVDRRYELFYKNEVVDIKEYNSLKKGRLSYQICIIDEFADLQSEKGSISTIEILTAKSRACGIHLIIATQRPDAKIVNGRIKANLPSVIGLKTINSLNSRIIIDEDGLEKLNGKGHGILKDGKNTQFQSVFLDVKEVKELIKHTYIDKEVKKEVKEIGKLTNVDFVKGLRSGLK